MIQPKELRIGNYGNRIQPNGQRLIDRLDDFDDACCFGAECEPISLTPEILEKCGFEMHKDKGLWRKGNFYLHFYTLSQNEYCFSYNDYKSASILYLHQLQNLYHALTGEELEINL